MIQGCPAHHLELASGAAYEIAMEGVCGRATRGVARYDDNIVLKLVPFVESWLRASLVFFAQSIQYDDDYERYLWTECCSLR